MVQLLRMRVMNWCLKHLFKAVTHDAFLQIKFVKNDTAGKPNGEIFENNVPLPEAQVLNLASEARALRQFTVYHKVKESLKTTASEMIFQKSKTIDDIMFGKAMLYAVDVMEKKFENISKL